MALSVDIQLSSEAKAALEDLKKRFETDTVKTKLLTVFNKFGTKVVSYIVTNLLSGQVLKRRSGHLARAVEARGVLVGGLPSVRVGIFRGPALKYAGVMELGTKPLNSDSPYNTIRPKNAKSLAVPVGDALTGAGVSRYQSPREYPGTLRFIPLRGARKPNVVGGLLDFRTGKLAYVLLSKLDLPPHWFLRNGMLAMLPELGQMVSDFLVGWLSNGK